MLVKFMQCDDDRDVKHHGVDHATRGLPLDVLESSEILVGNLLILDALE